MKRNSFASTNRRHLSIRENREVRGNDGKTRTMASRMFQRLVQPIGTNVIEKSFTLSHYRGTRRKSCGCRILISVYKWHMKPFATKCRSVICIDFGSFYCAPGFPLRRAHLIIIRISSSPGIGSSHGDDRLQHIPVVRPSTRTLVRFAME